MVELRKAGSGMTEMAGQVKAASNGIVASNKELLGPLSGVGESATKAADVARSSFVGIQGGVLPVADTVKTFGAGLDPAVA